MELEEGRLQGLVKQRSATTSITADGRSSTRSLVGTPKFSPKLKLTKVAVGRLVKLPQRSVECRTAVEGEEADGHESVESHLPMIVSYHLTEGLQRCITKVMRKRRKEQELSRKDARKRWRQKKSVYPKRQQLQHPASAASEATLLVAESGDLSVFDPAGELGTVVEGELEVQPDAIMKPFLSLRKKKIGATSRACFLDENDEETETETEVEPQHLSSQSSTPLHQDSEKNAAGTYREDTDRSEMCRASHQECEDLSSEGAKAVADVKEASEGAEAAGSSLSILSESQIDIQKEMDVLTSSADLETGKEPVPQTVAGIGSITAQRSQMEAAKWHIDPSLVVVNNDDFDTVIDQLSLDDQESEDDSVKEETKVIGYTGTQGQGHGLVVPAKTKMKLSIRSTRKYASTKRLSKTDFLSGSRRRRKLDKISKPRRRKDNEEKERITCPPGPSSAESASESNETSTCTSSKEGHKTDAEKKLIALRKAEQKQAVVKRSKARRRNCDPDVKDPFSDDGEPKHSLAANEKKRKGKPRKKKSMETVECSEDEELAISDNKPKGRPKKKKSMETVECSEDEELAISDNKPKGRPRKKKSMETVECSEDEELAISDNKPKGRPRKKKSMETVECSEDEELVIKERNAKRTIRPRKKHDQNKPSDYSEDEELAICDKKPQGKRNMETEPLSECNDSEAVVINDKKPKGRPRKNTEVNRLQSNHSEAVISDKKPKGRPRKKTEVNKLPSEHSEGEAAAVKEKKPRRRPRKHEPLAMSEKKTKGRRRNKGKEDHPLNSCGESMTTSEKAAKGRPRKRKREELPSDASESVAKKFRRPGKNNREDKLPSEHSELKLSPVFSNFEHQVSEDSGYPSSSINSRSPTDCVLMSPINMKHNTDFLQEDSFQEASNPILYDSNFGISKPETDTGSDIEASQGLIISQGEAGIEYSDLLHGMQPAFGGNTEIEPSNILYDLDLLLRQEPTIFGFDSNPDIKLESSNEVDEILRSPSVSSCIRDLQRSGALPCGNSPHPDGESHTGQLPNFIAITPIPSSNELVSGSQVAKSSSEGRQSSDVVKVSDDSSPSCVISTSSQKGAVVSRRRKQALPILPPSMQTKSGRRLKRSWKLCSDDPDLEVVLKRSTEDPCKSAEPEKSVTNSKGRSTNEDCEDTLDALQPELCSTNAPLSGITCKQGLENAATKGDTTLPNGMEKLVTDVSLSGGQETREPMDENFLASDTLRNQDGDKGGSPCKITTRVKPRISELKVPLRTVKVKLKRRCAKALCPSYNHCSSGSRPESDGLPSSKTTPPVGNNDVEEILPEVHSSPDGNMGTADEEQSTTAKDLCFTSAVLPHTSLEKESEGESMPSTEEKEVFTLNGLVHPGKKLPLSSQQRTSDGGVSSGGIFSSRAGSIFAGSHPSQAVTTSGNYIMPHVTNAETTNLKSQPNSVSSRALHNRTTPSAAYKQKSVLPNSTNSLSMSLDKVLQQMGEVKDNNSVVKTCRPSGFKISLSSSRTAQNGSGIDSVSSFEKGEVALGRIQYNSPSAYRASLASSAISDLILAPLNVGETLDEELKGESLFDSDIKDDCRAAESLLATSMEALEMNRDVHAEIEKDQQTFGEPPETYDSKSKPDDVPPPTQNLDDLGSECGSRIETLIPFKEPKSPPVLRKIHLSGMETEGEELMEEDCISLFPRDDDDLLGGDVNEEPLAKFYAKCPKLTKSVGTGVAKQASIRRRPVEPSRGYSPPPLDDGGFGSSFEKCPAVVPLKSQQVSQWVADQQKRKTIPSQASRPHLPSGTRKSPLIHLTLRGGGLRNPWGPSSGGNSHGVPHGNAAQMQAKGSSSPGPFVATNLPQGRSTSSQESDSYSNPALGWSAGSVGNRQYCRYFLLQRGCPLRACRFLHCSREHAPLHIVEEMVFRQPLEKISVEELRPYVTNHHSYCTLKNNFASFVSIMKSLLEKRFATAVRSAVDLITLNGMKFSTAFLCRLMEKCAVQTGGSGSLASPSSPSMTSVAETLLSAIEESRGGQLIPEDYHFYINVLVNFKATQQLSATYRAMKARDISPSTNTLFLLLRFIKSLDESIFPQLLDDVRQCQFTSVEKASYVSRLVECVDPQLVESHSSLLGKWLAETSKDITVKLSSRCAEHLYTIFTKKGQWDCVVELFASCSRYVHELGPNVCDPLATALQHLGPTDKLVGIAEALTEDQMTRMNSEFWDTVLQECAKKGKSQKTSIIYTALYRQKKQLAKETVSGLIRMYLGQHNHSAAISLFMESLHHGYSLVPPDQLLTSVCEAMEKTKATYNLYTVVKLLMECGILPPAAALQSMLTLCIAEKQFIKLADIVKLAASKGLLLERAFCQKALVELRHWGRDPDAISAAYKSLRKLSEGSGDTTPAAVTGPSTSTRVNHTLAKKTISICRRSSVNIPVVCPSPPPPPPPPQPTRRSISLTTDVERDQDSSVHESICEKPEILTLIEENGCRGQFGAVASVLTTLPNSTRSYSRNTVYSVWKGLVSTDQRAANCFSTLLESLDQYRAAKSHSVSEQRKPGSSLLPSDRWLISQVGIALLKGCDQHQDWQSGFLLLHNLHLHGIHYVKLSQPSSSLPPFVPRPPSPCEVAMLAVKMCLKMKQVTGALEVLHGCEWIKAVNDEELIKRTETLCSVAEKCLAEKKLQDAWKCLDSIDCGGKVVAGSINMITNLHNKLLQNVLSQKETSFALTIHRKMKHFKLQCLPTVFSALLQHLCDRKQVKLAKSLCKAAISENAYCPLVHNDLFKVVLTPGLVGVELHLLMEEHLRRLAEEVNVDSMQQLSIQFCPGSRHPLEQVLSQFIKPALEPSFASSNCATVSAVSLQQWCNVNHWNHRTSGGEGQSAPSTVVGQKRPFSEIGECAADGGRGSSGDVPAPGPEHEYESDPRTEMEPGSIAGPGRPRLGLRLEHAPVPTPEVASIPRESTEAVLQETASGDRIQQRQGKGDTWKDFKRAICNAVLTEIKPYYKEKFKCEDDYLHFFRVLTQNCSKLYKSSNISDCYHMQCEDGKEELVLIDSVLQRISTLVTSVVSRCQVYSRELDEELGLTSGFTSD